jgi:hypothetical protein
MHARLFGSNFKQPSALVPAPPRELGFWFISPFGGETGRRKAHLGNSRGLLPGLPENRGTRQRLSASRRGVLKPWSVLPGTWQTPVEVLEHGDLAPLACPRPASSQWQTQLRAGRKPRASRLRACEARPQAPHQPSGCPPASFRSAPLPNASRSAPHRTGREQDKRGSGDGDNYP